MVGLVQHIQFLSPCSDGSIAVHGGTGRTGGTIAHPPGAGVAARPRHARQQWTARTAGTRNGWAATVNCLPRRALPLLVCQFGPMVVEGHQKQQHQNGQLDPVQLYPLPMVAGVEYQAIFAGIVKVTRSLDEIDDGYHPELSYARKQKGNTVQETKVLETESGRYESNADGEEELSIKHVQDESNQEPTAAGRPQQNDLMKNGKNNSPRSCSLNACMVHYNTNHKRW
mmetsp:Transcript_26377/g.57166  ORF Transcript_26377/g.57166 Transcript_26377/m.57166 type:complete len:227 (+) Transcript_26377:1132-1812(+)